jgi:hypothetical protein
MVPADVEIGDLDALAGKYPAVAADLHAIAVSVAARRLSRAASSTSPGAAFTWSPSRARCRNGRRAAPAPTEPDARRTGKKVPLSRTQKVPCRGPKKFPVEDHSVLPTTATIFAFAATSARPESPRLGQFIRIAARDPKDLRPTGGNGSACYV